MKLKFASLFLSTAAFGFKSGYGSEIDFDNVLLLRDVGGEHSKHSASGIEVAFRH